MRRHVVDLAVILAFATLAMTYVALAQPGLRTGAFHVYVLVVGGILMLAIVLATSTPAPGRGRSSFDAALAEPSAREPALADLERLIREVTLGTSTAYDFQMRLAPHLRQIAWAQVERSGRTPGPDTLGRWWELLRPDRELGAWRDAGVAEADLRALVADLARMA